MTSPSSASRRSLRCLLPVLFLVLALPAPNRTRAADPASPSWDVARAGAATDASADATAIFQQQLDAAGRAGGGTVSVPAGRYRIDGTLSIPAHVTLQGVFRVAPTPGPLNLERLPGSVLLTRAGRGSTNDAPFITLAGNNAVLAGVIVAYPEWKQTDVPPVPYPPCVASRDTENVGILDCCLLNPYEGIRFVRAHRHLVRNVNGYPIWRGLFVDECYDIGRVENVHFWPFGVNYQPDDPFCRWVNTQGTAFEFARTDWHYVINTFCFGYGIGYRFSQSAQGSANGNFLGLGADSCERAVRVDQAQPPGLLITNGEFVGRWGSTNSVTVEIGPELAGKVSLVNCSFWGPIDRCVWMRGTNGQFTASACHFVHWDNRAAGSAAIQADAGKVLVQGCTFEQENLHVRVGPRVGSAILTGNQAAGGFRVENEAGARTQLGFNEADPIDWTPAARAHYRLRLGASGDGRYLRNWHGPERSDRPFRWSSARSEFLLPAPRNQPLTLRLVLHVPAAALSPEAGLYVDNRQLHTLTSDTVQTVRLPATDADRLRVELRCAGWVPAKTIAGSGDGRTLGVQVFEATVTAGTDPTPDGDSKVFDANTGQ